MPEPDHHTTLGNTCKAPDAVPTASLPEEKTMHTTRPASLLVAALALLRQPCSRSRATARMLLERAAETGELTPAECEVCRSLADDMDVERPDHRASAQPWQSSLPVV